MGCSPWGRKESGTTERLTLLYQDQGPTAFPGNFHGWRRQGLTSAGSHPISGLFGVTSPGRPLLPTTASHRELRWHLGAQTAFSIWGGCSAFLGPSHR